GRTRGPAPVSGRSSRRCAPPPGRTARRDTWGDLPSFTSNYPLARVPASGPQHPLQPPQGGRVVVERQAIDARRRLAGHAVDEAAAGHHLIKDTTFQPEVEPFRRGGEA